jgi:hypothetical protein
MIFGKIGVEWSQLKQAVCTEKYICVCVCPRILDPTNSQRVSRSFGEYIGGMQVEAEKS